MPASTPNKRNANHAVNAGVRIGKPFPWSRPRVYQLPSGAKRVVADYARRRNNGLSVDARRRHLTGVDLKVLRELKENEAAFIEGLELARASIAGQLAIAAKTDTNLFTFLQSKKYILVNRHAKVTGTNWKSFLGMGRDRIATAEIRWLINKLKSDKGKND
ncbi:MAG: hypothetical protein Q8P05_00190 [Candidatus Diapherotrites archaeon]|nr:hypothetical protein [Candidatus Diapherotrites archaeon]MDZ4256400.1 hypothetical protein [archaeon]